MRPRLLRRRCLQRLRHLAVPRPFEIAELCASLASARNRPIRLLPMRLPPAGPHGLWIAGALLARLAAAIDPHGRAADG